MTCSFIYLFFYGALSCYLYTASTSFDYSIIADNFHSAFSREATSIILHGLKIDPLIAVILTCGLVYMARRTFFALKPTKYRHVKGIFFTGTYLSLMFIPFNNVFDEPATFLKSIVQYYRSDHTVHLPKGTYPFMKESIAYGTQNFRKPGEKPPHVFIILVESFSASFINQKSPEGFEYTPYFNSLTKRGLYVPHFYGNSIQTAKGHFATLFSVVPSIKGMVYTRYPHIEARALPEILKDNGYETSFYQAHKNPDFDNTGMMMRKHGMMHLDALSHPKPEDQEFMSEWGVEDQIFYRHVFEKWDENHLSNKPQCVVLATIYSHGNFEVPAHRRMHYKNPKNSVEHYANAIGLVDAQFATFFEELKKRPELKNSIIVITGDHSYPMHGSKADRNEVGTYEDSFKMPFILLWPGHIAPVSQLEPASQLDIAPTLLDLVGIKKVSNHFQGQSLFKKRAMNRPIPLIQPYNGICISVVTYPYKYMCRLKTGEEFVYNLETDQSEDRNLVSQLESIKLKAFRAELKPILLSQQAIIQNQLWHK